MKHANFAKILHISNCYSKYALQQQFPKLPDYVETNPDMDQKLRRTLKRSQIDYTYHRNGNWMIIKGGSRDFPNIYMRFDKEFFLAEIQILDNYPGVNSMFEYLIHFTEIESFFMKMTLHKIITPKGLKKLNFGSKKGRIIKAMF